MPPKDNSDYVISETGNWNVADSYSKIKIMKPLANCDHYENVAKFGFDTLGEQLSNPGIPTSNLRLMGLSRLINELLMLIGNARFAMKKAGTLEAVEKFEKQLNKLSEFIPDLYKTSKNQRTKTSSININEKAFANVLNPVVEIKSKLNDPLNKNHLIFTDKEEFDPVAYKEAIIKQATTRG